MLKKTTHIDSTKVAELSNLLDGTIINQLSIPEKKTLESAFDKFNHGNIEEAYLTTTQLSNDSHYPYFSILNAYFATKAGKSEEAMNILEDTRLKFPSHDTSNFISNALRVFTRNQNTKIGIHVHALHKTASMFLYKFFKYICSFTDIHLYSINNKPPNHMDLSPEIIHSFCSCPERSFDMNNNIEKNTYIPKQYHIFQVRDPRDILVSQYYSFGWIHGDRNWSEHALKEREYIRSINIDEYALMRSLKPSYTKTPCLLDRYQPIISLADKPNVVVVKYEDMVLNFNKWLGPIVNIFDFKHPEQVSQHLFKVFQSEFIIPETEQRTHKRKISPGDHIEKLQPRTISNLNNIFSDILEHFDYR